MKQIKLFFSIIAFVFVSILLSSHYEAQSDTDTSVSNEPSGSSNRTLNYLKDFSFTPYFTGSYPSESVDLKLKYKYSGTEGDLDQQERPFAKLDAIDEFHYRTIVIPKGGHGCNGLREKTVEDKVDDLVDDYFDGFISYEQLEYELDDLGYGVDPFWGPYPYSDYLYLDGKAYGCSISRYRINNISPIYYRASPETAGIQYDQFQLINADYQLQD